MRGDTAPKPDPRGPLFESDPRPMVALPRAGVPGIAIAAGAALLALLLFVVLDAQRRRARPTESGPSSGMIASPPALAVPPEPEAAPTPFVTMMIAPPLRSAPAPIVPPRQQQPVMIVPVAPLSASVPDARGFEVPARATKASEAEAALVFDGGSEADADGLSPPGASAGTAGGSSSRQTAAGGTGDDTPARATAIRNQTDVMPVGTIIPAVLETPVDSARPGLVRALVSRDTAGFDGRRVLVPRGSRLIGEYQSDVGGGQNRVLITWTRLIRPDGISIRLGSPASDPLGGAGVPGQVHTFFLERFAGAVLQSALQIGVNLASRPSNGSVIVGIQGAPVNVVGQQLQSTNDYRPKITVKQGTKLNVFVARDLDFAGVGPSR